MASQLALSTYTFKPVGSAVTTAILQVNTITFSYQGQAVLVTYTVFENAAELAANNPLTTGTLSIPNTTVQSDMNTLISQLAASGLTFTDNSGSTISTAGSTAS